MRGPEQRGRGSQAAVMQRAWGTVWTHGTQQDDVTVSAAQGRIPEPQSLGQVKEGYPRTTAPWSGPNVGSPDPQFPGQVPGEGSQNHSLCLCERV